MYRTEIITHFKKFHGLSELTESFQIDIDCIEAVIEDMKLVKENCNLQNVVGQGEQLTYFLLHLNEKGLINNHDFDYEEEAKKYIKKNN